jgi:hypothetical protein
MNQVEKMALITLPWVYVPNKDKFGTYFDAKIYVGEPDNPNPRTSQKETRLVQEDGTSVIAQQPIRTNAGGIPVYNGSVVALDVDGDYSLAIDDSNDQQKYYFANNGSSEDFLTTDLRSIIFDLGLTYDDIGVKLITDVAGNSLDDAEYIINSGDGTVWSLYQNPEIPLGATVVSLNGSLLTTSVGSYTLEKKQNDISQGLENQIKVNQNWNVTGVDATLTTTAQTITNGDEFTKGWIAYNADIVDIARSASGITTWTTGTARYTLPKDLNGLLTVDSVKFYVNDGLGDQVEADGANGLTVSDDTNNIYLDIDETKGAKGVGFVGWSLFQGIIPAINDEESSNLIYYKKISVADYKSSGTAGGSSVFGFQERNLNTILTNTLNATLSQNEVTLDAGTYIVYASAPCFQGKNHRISVKNGDGSIILLGTTEYNDATYPTQTSSVVAFEDFTITQQDTFKINHFITSGKSNDGLGVALLDNRSEVYAQLIFWKVK